MQPFISVMVFALVGPLHVNAAFDTLSTETLLMGQLAKQQSHRGRQLQQCSENPMMWKIEKDGVLRGVAMGTVHVPVSVVDLPENVLQEAGCVREVVVELDITDPAIKQAIAGCINNLKSTNRSIENLSEESIQILDEVMEKAGNAVPIDLLFPPNWRDYPPTYLTNTLNSVFSGLTVDPNAFVDLVVYNSNSQRGSFETAEDQCKVLTAVYNVPAKVENCLFRDSVAALDATYNGTSMFAPVVDTYNCGDLSGITTVRPPAAATSDCPTYDQTATQGYLDGLNRALWTDRDPGFAAKMISDMEKYPGQPAMYAIGTGHWKEVTNLLEAAGYNFTQYTRAEEASTCPSSSASSSTATLRTVVLFAILSLFTLL